MRVTATYPLEPAQFESPCRLQGRKLKLLLCPVFRRKRIRRFPHNFCLSATHARYQRNLERRFRIEAGRKWWCEYHTLAKQWDRIDGILRESRKTVA